MYKKRTETRWPKSNPTLVSKLITPFTCTYERQGKSCKKAFSRQCDLRQHQKNHTRPSRCQKCSKGFPSVKDLERHHNSVHDNTINYFCTHEWCPASIKLAGPYAHEWFDRGFRRKDYWQKHMKDYHTASREVMRDLWKNGIPMARKVDGQCIPVFPKGNQEVSP